MSTLEFKHSEPFTLGVELELQILNRRDFDLSSSAPDLLRRRSLACRFGIEAEFIDVKLREKISVREDLLRTLDLALRHASDLSGADAMRLLQQDVQALRNGSLCLREEYKRTNSLGDVVRAQCEIWSGRREA